MGWLSILTARTRLSRRDGSSIGVPLMSDVGARGSVVDVVVEAATVVVVLVEDVVVGSVVEVVVGGGSAVPTEHAVKINPSATNRAVVVRMAVIVEVGAKETPVRPQRLLARTPPVISR